MEDLRALQAGLCDGSEAEACAEDFEGNLEWACANCPKKRPEHLSPYTHKLLRLRALKAAGYPFKADDLSPEDWLDLGKVILCLETPRL